MLCCSYCGQNYPNSYQTCTCRVCGGLIEEHEPNYQATCLYRIDEIWHDWRDKMLSAPPQPMRESDWYEICAHYNSCAICGVGNIDEKRLLVPVNLGGKYYNYNVFPVCSNCNEEITHYYRQANPFRQLIRMEAMTLEKLDHLLSYLEVKMLGAVFEEFDFEHDNVEIICKVVEDTSIKPFNGIYARRLFEYPNKIRTYDNFPIKSISAEENLGITWRLLDDDTN